MVFPHSGDTGKDLSALSICTRSQCTTRMYFISDVQIGMLILKVPLNVNRTLQRERSLTEGPPAPVASILCQFNSASPAVKI